MVKKASKVDVVTQLIYLKKRRFLYSWKNP